MFMPQTAPIGANLRHALRALLTRVRTTSGQPEAWVQGNAGHVPNVRLVSMIALLAGIALAQGGMITLDPAVKYQKWDGWGTSLCWWANVLGEMPSVRETLTKQIFGYLKLNIVRYNIGGGENPEHHHMQPRAQMQGFLDENGKVDWSRDSGQRWVLQRAKQLGANRFEAFANSPPWFLTISKCASGGKDGKPNLDPAKVDDFAGYLAAVDEHFLKSWGVRFETIEPLNEPSGTNWKFAGKQEGCSVPAGADQSRVIVAMREGLDRRQLDTHIAASDESNIDTAVSSWDALSPKAKSLVWRIDTHHYGGTKLKELHQRAVDAKKDLWMSEEGDKDSSGMTTAQRIVEDLRDMQPTAWIYWQAIDQTGTGWGLIDMDLNARKTNAVTNKRYYVFANFTRFIPPGATFFSVDDPDSVAASVGKTAIVVTLNRGDDKQVSYDVSRLGRIQSVKAYRTSPTENCAQIDAALANGARLDADLPARSVTTFVIEHG